MIFASYLEAAYKQISNLQKYEKAPSTIEEIKEGQENEQFFKIWFNTEEKLQKYDKNHFSKIISEMNYFYKDIDISSKREEQKKKIMSDIKSSTDKLTITRVNSKIRKAFYLFPEEEIPESLIDIEDLTDNDYLVACVEDYCENKFIIHTWKGASVNIDQKEEKEYIIKIKLNFFSPKNFDDVILIEETPYNESDDFINLL